MTDDEIWTKLMEVDESCISENLIGHTSIRGLLLKKGLVTADEIDEEQEQVTLAVKTALIAIMRDALTKEDNSIAIFLHLRFHGIIKKAINDALDGYFADCNMLQSSDRNDSEHSSSDK